MRIVISILIVLIVLMSSCLDPIVIDVSAENTSRLVVAGQLNDSGEKQIIRLSTSLPFGNKSTSPVTGAQIQLCDLGLGLCEDYYEEEEGVYSLWANNITPTPGHEYYITIDLENGSQYESSPQILPLPQKADSVYYNFERKNTTDKFGVERITDVINVFIDTKLDRSGGTQFFRWNYDELYIFPDESCGPLEPVLTCYVPIEGDNQNITLFSSDLVDQDKILGINVAIKNTFPLIEFRSRHYFNVYQYSISEEAFTYWTRVKSIILQAGTVIDIPPASIPGNIRNINDSSDRVLGFFEVASRDIQRTFLFPSDFKENISQFEICSRFDRRNWGPECCDCTTIPNASLVRPEWIK